MPHGCTGAACRSTPRQPLELLVTHRAVAGSPDRLVYHPPVLALGVGAEAGAPAEALSDLVDAVLAEHGLAPRQRRLRRLARPQGGRARRARAGRRARRPRPLLPGRAAARARPPRLATPSEIVFRETGCWGVAEGAALAAVGPEGRLLVPKRKGERVTCAVALAPRDLDPAAIGRPQGRLAVVGLGPGDPRWRTGEAQRAAGRGRGAGRLRPLSRPDRPRRRRQAAPRVPARRRGRALPLRAGARRRGPQRGPGLLGRSRHLRPGDAGVRAAGERRRSRLGARRRHRQPRRLRPAGGGGARRRAARPRFLRHLALRPADARPR